VAVVVSHDSSASPSGAPVAAAPGTDKADPGAAASVKSAQEELAASLTLSTQWGATAVPWGTPITLTSSMGNLSLVQVTDASGAPIAGTIESGGHTWKLTGNIVPSATYHVSATVTTPDGMSAQRSGTFTMAPPSVVVSATVFPSDGGQVGVGQPIVLKFDHDISDLGAQEGVIPHLTVAMSKPVPGGWYWFSSTELHFRPTNYWPAGEQVRVTGNLNGWDAGGGKWGAGTLTDSFSVGASRISVANLATHEMTVTLNGAVVATYPLSGGRPQYPTMNGTHIVLDRESVVHMVSSTVGIPVNSPNGYDEFVYEDVHISDSGEYVHAAPWSVGSQGFVNVSHGCINLSTSNATSFYNFSRVGDIVQVVGGPRPPVDGDHGVMDWSESLHWMPGKVVALS
jgi:lipoprotein-anchoring transpeptidase ErfK/SrfK